MELYKQYVEELHPGKSVYYNDQGFAVYIIRDFTIEGMGGKEVYIEDIYTKPEFRRTHAAAKMADAIALIAKERGVKYMTGTVVPSANDSTRSLQMMLGYNFKLWFSDANIIWFIKEI